MHLIYDADLHKVFSTRITKWIPRLADLFYCAVTWFKNRFWKVGGCSWWRKSVVSSFLRIHNNYTSASARAISGPHIVQCCSFSSSSAKPRTLPSPLTSLLCCLRFWSSPILEDGFFISWNCKAAKLIKCLIHIGVSDLEYLHVRHMNWQPFFIAKVVLYKEP